MNIVRCPIDLHSLTMCRKIPSRLVPDFPWQRCPTIWISPHQQRGRGEFSEQRQDIAHLTRLLKNTDHRLSTHLAHRVDLTLYILLSPSYILSDQFWSQLSSGTPDIFYICRRTFFGIAASEIARGIFENDFSKVRNIAIGHASTRQYKRGRTTPGVPNQHGLLQT